MSEFLTIDEMSDVLSMSRQTVTKYVTDGQIKGVRIGKSYRILKRDFFDFINEQSISSEPIIEYKAIDYQGFNFLDKIRNGIHNSDYEINELRISHDGLYNKYILGDNLSVLNELMKDIQGKVDLVYIDPPFGTGQIFSDLNENQAYKDTLINEDFLSFLRDRLYLLKNCLSERGSIYLHIDKKIGHYVKIIMDEVFGYKNFINDITRIKCNPKNFKRKAYGNFSDMVLYYVKNRDKQIWNDITESLTKEDEKKLFPKIDEKKGRYTTHPVHAPGVTDEGDTGKEWMGILPPKGRHWRYSREVLTKLNENGLIEWSSTGNPRKIVFAKDHTGKKVQDVWEFKDKGKSYVDYPTQKNDSFLERIILNSSVTNSIVLDCFAGSGSTLVSANKYGRKWIGIDESEHSFQTVKNVFKKNNIKCNYYKLNQLSSKVAK